MFDCRYACRITIAGLVLTIVNEVEIVEAWNEFTTTAVLKIPKRVLVKSGSQGKVALGNYVKTGDPVKVELGYDGKLKTEFVGYVARSPKPTMPLEIMCEDEMWQLKRKSVSGKTFTNAKLSEVIKHIAPGYKTDVLDINIDRLIIGLPTPETAAQVLKKLKDDWGLQSFFRLDKSLNPVLVVGKPQLWNLSSQKEVYPDEAVYHLQRNVADNALEYKSKEDARVKMEYKLRLANGRVENCPFTGDQDGEVRSITFVGVSMATVTQWAKEDYLRHKKDGYAGDITGFGIPYTRAGQIARIVDADFEVRDSRYIIDRVVVQFGQGGFRRINTIGYQV